jgi:CRISPR-associated protein (TIGR03986 family)
MANKFHHQHAEGFEAIAPYNFVPLPEAVFTPAEEPAAQDRYHENRHTGYIKLDIKTETPLYVRCAYPPNVPVDEKTGKPDFAKQPEGQNFFHRGNPAVPVIPGSSLRGMTRSLVEILTSARIAGVFDKTLTHRGVGDMTSMGSKYRNRTLGPNQTQLPKMKFEYPVKNLRGGYLERKGNAWCIRPAVEHLGESFIHIEETTIVNRLGSLPSLGRCDIYVQPESRNDAHPRTNPRLKLNLAVAKTISQTNGGTLQKATLVISGFMESKHLHCAIYDKNNDADPILIPQTLWELYEQDSRISRGDNTETRHLDQEGHGAPLFYLMEGNKLVFFGPTMMLRLPYPNALEAFVSPEEARGITEKERADEAYDLAETIFGTVRPQSQRIMAGRVFFSDAVWAATDTDPFLCEGATERFIPQILATPKPTSFQIYLNQPQAKDKTDRNGNKKQDGDLVKSYYDANGTVIRGFKQYWHKKSLKTNSLIFRDENAVFSDAGIDAFRKDDKGTEYHRGARGRWQRPSTQHTAIRPVKSGVAFSGRVYFENLSDRELGALLTALGLPPSKRHKLGMGKPLGLGTVKLIPHLVLQTRTPNDKQNARYDKLFDDADGWQEGGLTEEETKQIAVACKAAFCSAMLQHYNNGAAPQVDETKGLEQIPRLKALYTLLEWDMAISDELQIAYMLPDAPAAKARYVLPKPEDVMRLAGRQTAPATDTVSLSDATINLKTKAFASENAIEKYGLSLVEVSFDKLKK